MGDDNDDGDTPNDGRFHCKCGKSYKYEHKLLEHQRFGRVHSEIPIVTAPRRQESETVIPSTLTPISDSDTKNRLQNDLGALNTSTQVEGIPPQVALL